MRIVVSRWSGMILVVAMAGTLAACGKKKDSEGSASMTLKIRNAENDGAAGLTEGSALSDAGAGNLSCTPDSFKLWINTIVLQNDDASASNQFYMCNSSAADCEVDFADPTSIAAFEAKLSSLTVTAGTYTKVWLSCSPDSGGYMKFKGHVTLADGVKYTADADANGGDPVTSDATKAGLVTIGGLNGCGITMPLSKALVVESSAASDDSKETVAAGSTLTMTIFSNLRLVTYYNANVSPGLGGCIYDHAKSGGPGFCSNYPSVFPYFGETTPTVEYYKVANSKTSSTGLTLGDANVLVKVIKSADGTPFWASFNSLYTESTPDSSSDKGVSGYTNSVTKFAINADASLTIKSQDFGFSAFKRTTHTGEVIGEGIHNGAGTGTGATYYYSAFPYNP